MENRIVIATSNQGKLAEYKAYLEPLGYEVLSLVDFPKAEESLEPYLTFAENAQRKANELHSLTGGIVIADDSGLCVDILGGLPSVWSARISGAGWEANNAWLLEKLASVSEMEKRSARYVTCIAVAGVDKATRCFSGESEGFIGFESRGKNGFAYDNLFHLEPDEESLTYAELSLGEKNKISSRVQAIKKVLDFLGGKSYPRETLSDYENVINIFRVTIEARGFLWRNKDKLADLSKLDVIELIPVLDRMTERYLAPVGISFGKEPYNAELDFKQNVLLGVLRDRLKAEQEIAKNF